MDYVVNVVAALVVSSLCFLPAFRFGDKRAKKRDSHFNYSGTNWVADPKESRRAARHRGLAIVGAGIVALGVAALRLPWAWSVLAGALVGAGAGLFTGNGEAYSSMGRRVTDDDYAPLTCPTCKQHLDSARMLRAKLAPGAGPQTVTGTIPCPHCGHGIVLTL